MERMYYRSKMLLHFLIVIMECNTSLILLTRLLNLLQIMDGCRFHQYMNKILEIMFLGLAYLSNTKMFRILGLRKEQLILRKAIWLEAKALRFQ